MDNQMVNYYTEKLERKQTLLSNLQKKNDDFECELNVSETIKLNVLQAEVRLLKEFLEDLKSC